MDHILHGKRNMKVIKKIRQLKYIMDTEGEPTENRYFALSHQEVREIEGLSPHSPLEIFSGSTLRHVGQLYGFAIYAPDERRENADRRQNQS